VVFITAISHSFDSGYPRFTFQRNTPSILRIKGGMNTLTGRAVKHTKWVERSVIAEHGTDLDLTPESWTRNPENLHIFKSPAQQSHPYLQIKKN
jgi:hypothetical protein